MGKGKKGDTPPSSTRMDNLNNQGCPGNFVRNSKGQCVSPDSLKYEGAIDRKAESMRW